MSDADTRIAKECTEFKTNDAINAIKDLHPFTLWVDYMPMREQYLVTYKFWDLDKELNYTVTDRGGENPLRLIENFSTVLGLRNQPKPH